jgi:hypothetical protein
MEEAPSSRMYEKLGTQLPIAAVFESTKRRFQLTMALMKLFLAIICASTWVAVYTMDGFALNIPEISQVVAKFNIPADIIRGVTKGFLSSNQP